MAHADSESFEIVTSPPEMQQAALELILRQHPPSERAQRASRLAAAARTRDSRLDGLLVALRKGELAGAIWIQPQPGRVASVWPPNAAHRQWQGCADLLLAVAIQRLEALDVRIAQSLLFTGTGESATLLLRHGFRHMADLLYMFSKIEQFPVDRPAGALVFEPFNANDLDRIAAIIEQTYEGTLDCPALGEMRDIRDVLSGYRASGVFDPKRWLAVRRDGRDIGCLLLTDYPDEQQWEIVYAGLASAARGQGLGATIARYAQWRTREAGRPRLVLAVDAANTPAVSAYATAGFVVWDRRSAFLLVFPDRLTEQK